MPAVSMFKPSGDAYVDGVLGTTEWAVDTLTYSFPSDSSYYGSSYGDGENRDDFAPLRGTQQDMVETALKAYAAISDLHFRLMSETSGQHADLRYAQSDVPRTAWTYLPSTAADAGDGWFNRSGGDYVSPVKGNYAYDAFLHELGHSMGLEHPHESGMPIDQDSVEYTVMSYRSYVGASATMGYVNETYGYPQSLMMYDVAAIQQMYGANFDTNSASTTYKWSPTTGEMFVNGIGQGAPGTNRIFLTVWDGGGNDTYDFSNYTSDLKVDLNPGRWTTTSSSQLAKLKWDGSHLAVGNIANALMSHSDMHSLIENAVGGSGDDVITGNQAANVLKGGVGHDTISGGAGNDTIEGGANSDRLTGGSGNDTFVFTPDTKGTAKDVITDFGDVSGNSDVIELSGQFSGVTSSTFQAWKDADVKQVGHDSVIAVGDDKIVLAHVRTTTLDYSDFHFVA